LLHVTRIAGEKHDIGTAFIVDDDADLTWTVPIVRSRTSGKLAAAQTDYECQECNIQPDFVMTGDLNDAVREFLEKE
jgi:hypothetical protein